MASHVKVTIPATTANLGPGFDCLGMALGLFNTVEMWTLESEAASPTAPVPEPHEVQVTGEGEGHLPEDSTNLILRAATALFEKVGTPMPRLRVKAENGIPTGSGLGSSAAAVVGGLVAANALLDGVLSRTDLLRLAFEIEGHPDNAAPALYGGLVIVSASEEELMTRVVATPEMRVAIALPNLRLSTAEARAALPKTVPMADAVFNIGRAALVIKAFEAGDLELLRWAMTDRLHQPYRRRLIPGYDDAVSAARVAGAAAVALSGAGPSLIAFGAENHDVIAQAMAAAFQRAGLSSRTFVLPVDRQGVSFSVSG